MPPGLVALGRAVRRSPDWSVRLISEAVPGCGAEPCALVLRCLDMLPLSNSRVLLTLAAEGSPGTPFWVTVVTLFVAVISSGSALTGVWLTRQNRRDAVTTRLRDDEARLYELVRRLHEDLTTGEVLRARSVLGHVVHSKHVIGAAVPLRDALDAYFSLLWCFERIHAGHRVVAASQASGAQAFFRHLFQCHIDEWHSSIYGEGRLRTRIEEALDGLPLIDGHALWSFKAVCRDFGKTIPEPGSANKRPQEDQVGRRP